MGGIGVVFEEEVGAGVLEGTFCFSFGRVFCSFWEGETGSTKMPFSPSCVFVEEGCCCSLGGGEDFAEEAVGGGGGGRWW